MDVRVPACNAATLSVMTAGKPWAYRAIRAITSVVAAKTHMTSLVTLENLRNRRAPGGLLPVPSPGTGLPIGLVSMYRDRRETSTTAQHAASTTTANVPCGGIRAADEINIYNVMRVDPLSPKYKIPSCTCAARMAPEFPLGIV